ncbi:HHL1-like protein [Synechococcus sp. PCC 7336]|uniref:HHL1-like protein n=1 Tax=Synechococcus sp. PCC 7336 TaxID=195250 RepID=UPI00034796CF|nr:HHL1-like protein [Synechococcus sp. PCC 7336]
MAEQKGFGQSKPHKKKSASTQKRKAAATQYDKMQSQGLPEFNIYIRDRNKPQNWLPVGSVAVKRSAAIDAAIFQNEAELLKGAFRLFPRLAKRREQLEYGYRLKDELYADEAIQVAVRPVPNAVQKLTQMVGRWLKSWRGGAS